MTRLYNDIAGLERDLRCPTDQQKGTAMDQPFATTVDAAFALLTAHREGQTRLTRGGGSLCGEIVADPRPLTEKQRAWLDKLIDKAGLPPLADGEAGA